MQKRTVTWVALGGLVVAGVAAYLLQRSPADVVAAANGQTKQAEVSGSAAGKADGKGADAKAAAAKGPGKGPGGPGGPVPVEVIELVPQRVV
jgi:hypothetical protein